MHLRLTARTLARSSAFSLLVALLVALAAPLVQATGHPTATRPVPGPAQPQEAPMIRYTIRLPDHQAHRVHVQLDLDGLAPGPLLLSMPVWTPGSYLVREFARHVLELKAVDADGAALRATKIDKNTWRIDRPDEGPVSVTYQLYANEVSVRTSHVDADHAFISPAGTFFAIDGQLDVPYHVAIEPPTGWQVFTPLSDLDEGWLAADFDELVDSPIEVGPHEELGFELDGVPHRLVMAGETDIDKDKLTADVRRIVEEVSSVFGQLPFHDYTFFFALVDSGGGGLEHKNSSVCMTARWKLSDPAKYRDFLSLVAHEYFHAWNVKRFRPAGLGPFDYNNEVYTRDLWVAEGITSYLDDLCTLRAGFYDKLPDYLKERGTAFKKEAERRGSRHMSMAEASHDAWIKLYRPDENSSNATISYYSKGALVALMLDLRIRRLSLGQKSLRDALRLGWTRFTEQGEALPDGGLEALASETAGEDLSTFFRTNVLGTEPLTPDPDLRWVGLELAITPSETKRRLERDEDGFALAPWLGITTKSSGGLCRVQTVEEGGPAWIAGINHDDLLLALDDMRITNGTLQDRLDRTAGASVTIAFYRGETLRRIDVQPELRRLEDWVLRPLENVTDEQTAAFEAWAGEPMPERKP
jgi:predicted metalloprotease with PDZ domain